MKPPTSLSPPPPPSPPESRSRPERLRQLVSDYTGGFRRRDLARLFEREAPRAYDVLTRNRRTVVEPDDDVERFFFRVKELFLGISYRLSPPRRLLFAGSILLVAGGLVLGDWSFSAGGVSLDFEPLPFLAAFGIMMLLLILELVERVQIRDELEIARQLQSDLLPEGDIDLPGYDICHAYRPAREVGGDYYAILPLPDGRVALVVADASGHGVGAGLLMAITEATLRLALDLDPSPTAVAELVNRSLWQTGGRRSFVSLFYALLTPETGRMDYVCAGHPFPLLRRGRGEVEELGVGAMPLGLRRRTDLSLRTTRLEPGDLLVLYTDGLPEAVKPDGEEDFGFERLRALVAEGGGAEAVHGRLLASLESFLGAEPLADDVSIAVMARVGDGEETLAPELPPLPPLPPPGSGR